MNKPDEGTKHRYLLFELTRNCQNNCRFCYNVWKEEGEYPRDELTAEEAIRLMDKVITETGCRFIGLTGGEPLLKTGFFDIAAFIASRGVSPVLISNGKLLDMERAERCRSIGIEYFEVSLHSDRREVHDRLAGREGSFEEAIDAILNIKKLGGLVNTVFVATRENIERFKEYVELNALLRVDSILFNRVACGGTGIADFQDMAPSPQQIREALETGNRLSPRYGISISVGVQVPPCLVDLSDLEHVTTGLCPLNGEIGEQSYMAIDPAGNLRLCNRARFIVGNLAREPLEALLRKPEVAHFCRAVPDFCRGCSLAEACAGGCKADALSGFGTLTRPDPFLELWKESAVLPVSGLGEQPTASSPPEKGAGEIARTSTGTDMRDAAAE